MKVYIDWQLSGDGAPHLYQKPNAPWSWIPGGVAGALDAVGERLAEIHQALVVERQPKALRRSERESDGKTWAVAVSYSRRGCNCRGSSRLCR